MKSAGSKQMRLDAFTATNTEKSAKQGALFVQGAVQVIDDDIQKGEMSEKRRRMTAPSNDDALIDLTDAEDDMLPLVQLSKSVNNVPKTESEALDAKTKTTHPTSKQPLSCGSIISGDPQPKNRLGDAEAEKEVMADGNDPLPVFWTRHIADGADGGNSTGVASRSGDGNPEAVIDGVSSTPLDNLPEQPDISVITSDVFLAKGSVFKKRKPDPKPPNLDCTSNSEKNN